MAGHTKNLKVTRNSAKTRVEAARKIQRAYRAALARRRVRAATAKLRNTQRLKEMHVLLTRGEKIITQVSTQLFKRYEWSRVLMSDMTKDSIRLLKRRDVNTTNKDLVIILTTRMYLQTTLLKRMRERARSLPPKKKIHVRRLFRDYEAIATKLRGIMSSPVGKRILDTVGILQKYKETLIQYGKRRGIQIVLPQVRARRE